LCKEDGLLRQQIRRQEGHCVLICDHLKILRSVSGQQSLDYKKLQAIVVVSTGISRVHRVAAECIWGLRPFAHSRGAESVPGRHSRAAQQGKARGSYGDERCCPQNWHSNSRERINYSFIGSGKAYIYCGPSNACWQKMIGVLLARLEEATMLISHRSWHIWRSSSSF
jgi:hypothetical protein